MNENHVTRKRKRELNKIMKTNPRKIVRRERKATQKTKRLFQENKRESKRKSRLTRNINLKLWGFKMVFGKIKNVRSSGIAGKQKIVNIKPKKGIAGSNIAKANVKTFGR